MTAERALNKAPIRPGELIACYRPRPVRGWELLAWLLLSAMAVGGPLLYGYYRLQYALAYYGPAAALTWSQPWFWMVALALAASLALLVIRLVESRRHIDVHANGLLLALSHKRFLPWGSISGVASGAIQGRFLGIPLATRYQATLYPSVGRPLSLESRSQYLPELLTQVKARLYPKLLPRLMEAFNQGKRIYFGDIGIDPHELQINRGSQTIRRLAWKQVARIQVEAGVLVITGQDQPAVRLPVADVPNLELLLQIIQTGVNP